MKPDDSGSVESNGSRLVASISGILVAGIVFLIPFVSANANAATLAILPAVAVGMLGAVGVIGLSKVRVFAGSPSSNPAVWLALAVPAFMLVAAAFHPGPDTWGVLAFALGGSALSLVIWCMPRVSAFRYVVGPLLAAASVQAVVAAAQLATGRALVPEWLAVGLTPRMIDGVVRAQGTMDHVYALSALALLAIGGWAAVRVPHQHASAVTVVGLALSGALVMMTFSRSAALGLAAVLVVLAFQGARGDRSARRIAFILVGVCVVTLSITFSSWSARVDHSLGNDIDSATLGRVTLIRQAVVLIESEPVVGVGPGQYVHTLTERGMADPRFPWMVHVLPLAFAAENGLLAGLTVSGLLVWLGFAAIRAGPGPSAAFFSTLPLIVFDVMHYATAAGRLMFGTWLGLLAAALRWRAEKQSDLTGVP